MDADGWRQLITAAKNTPPVLVRAEEYRKKWGSFSQPVLVACDDGNEYVAKGRHIGRPLFTDHVVGRLGEILGAPVGRVVLVDIPAELINVSPQMQHMTAGISHGTQFEPGCSDRLGVQHVTDQVNRSRFAYLAILYGCVGSSDHQVIYKLDPPHTVYSVDHGHFFPGSTGWNAISLQQAEPAVPEPWVMQSCNMTPAELEQALCNLEKISDRVIAEVVAGPPNDWGVGDEDRVAVATFLARRRDELLGGRLGQ